MGTIFDSSFGSTPNLDYNGSNNVKSFGPAVKFEAESIVSQYQHEIRYRRDDIETYSDMPELSSRHSSRNSSRPSSFHSCSSSGTPEVYIPHKYCPTLEIVDDSEPISPEQLLRQSYLPPESPLWPLDYVTSYESSLHAYSDVFVPTPLIMSAAELFNPCSDLLLETKQRLPSRKISCTPSYNSWNILDDRAMSDNLVKVAKYTGIQDERKSMFNHFKERPEKCPIATCDYHVKGFRRKYDFVRHTLTHFKGSMLCYFCPIATARAFDRVDTFKRHLISVHGAQNISQHNVRKTANSKAKIRLAKQSEGCMPAMREFCSICFLSWNIQDFYDHLNDCVMNSILKHISAHPFETGYQRQTVSPTYESIYPSMVSELVEIDQIYHPDLLATPNSNAQSPTGDFQAYSSKMYSKVDTSSFQGWDAPTTTQKRAVSAISAEPSPGVTKKQEQRPKAQRSSVSVPVSSCPGSYKCIMQNSLSGDREYKPVWNELPQVMALESPATVSRLDLESRQPSPKSQDILDREGQSRLAFKEIRPKPETAASTKEQDFDASARKFRLRRRAPLRQGIRSAFRSLASRKELSESVENEKFVVLSNSLNGNASIAETPGRSCGSLASSPGTELSEDASDNESISECSTNWGEDQDKNSPSSDIYQVLASSEDNQIEAKTNLLKPALSPMKQALVDRIMAEFWMIVNQEWATNLTKCAGDTPASSSPPGSNMDLNSGAPLRPANGKRQRDDGEEPPPEGNDGRMPKRPNSNSEKKPPKNGVKFACPYRKHAPHTYTIYKHRSCALSHWDTVARLKEHLFRRHKVPIQCKRCWKTFKAQEELDTHLTVVNICKLQPAQAAEGLTAEMEKRLRSRKKSSPDQTEAARWKEIYGILFPNEVAPNPYFEPVQENMVQSPDSRELADYEEFSRQQLPKFFRSYLEDAVNNETQHLEEHIRSQLVSIVQDCQDRMFLAYKSRAANKESKAATNDRAIDMYATSPVPILGISGSDTTLEPDKAKPKDIVASVYRAPSPAPQSTVQCILEFQDISNREIQSRWPGKNNFSDSGYYSNGTENSQVTSTQPQTQDISLAKTPYDSYQRVLTGFGDTIAEDLGQISNLGVPCHIPYDFDDPEWNISINFEPEV